MSSKPNPSRETVPLRDWGMSYNLNFSNKMGSCCVSLTTSTSFWAFETLLWKTIVIAIFCAVERKHIGKMIKNPKIMWNTLGTYNISRSSGVTTLLICSDYITVSLDLQTLHFKRVLYYFILFIFFIFISLEILGFPGDVLKVQHDIHVQYNTQDNFEILRANG